MTRIAWCSPWTPDRVDAAERSSVVVSELRARGFQIEVISSTQHAAACLTQLAGCDLAVYHLGNAPEYDHVWPLVFARPGLAVLHEGRLHAARSRLLLGGAGPEDPASIQSINEYRAEFAWNHPHVAPAIAELAVRGHEGSFSSQWLMVRAVLASSRMTITHAAGAITELTAESRDATIEYVPASQGHDLPRATGAEVVVAADATWFEASRVAQVLRAFAGVRARVPDARLLLAGPTDRPAETDEMIRALGLQDVVRQVSRWDEDVIAAADVVLWLHWPAALDMPGFLLRALAAGRASAILDLAHLATIPALDPRTWRLQAPADRGVDAENAAVTVSIDVMDEDHSLRLALQRLLADAPLRARLGRAAQAYWDAEHSPARMVDGYARAISRALASPPPRVSELPNHLRQA